MQLIGIIGAMEPEVALLRQQISDVTTTELGSYTFYCGTLSGVNVVLVQSGIAKSHQHWPPRYLFNILNLKR